MRPRSFTAGPFRPSVRQEKDPKVFAAELLLHRAEVFLEAVYGDDEAWAHRRFQKLRLAWLLCRDAWWDPDDEIIDLRRRVQATKDRAALLRRHVRFLRRETGYSAQFVDDPEVDVEALA